MKLTIFFYSDNRQLQRRFDRQRRHSLPPFVGRHDRTESRLRRVADRPTQNHFVDEHRRNVDHHRRRCLRRRHRKDQNGDFRSDEQHDDSEAGMGVVVEREAEGRKSGSS